MGVTVRDGEQGGSHFRRIRRGVRRERLDALLTRGLTPQELARYKAAGATMREGDVFELACGGDA